MRLLSRKPGTIDRSLPICGGALVTDSAGICPLYGRPGVRSCARC